MTKIFGIGLIAFLLFWLQKKLYEKLWNKHLKVSISFSEKAIFEGGRGELKEIIENKKRLPISMLKVKFQTNRNLFFEDGKGSRTTDRFYRSDVFRIGSSERITRHLKFTGGRRGYYTIENMDLIASDLFLTSQFIDRVPFKETIYVYPKPFDSREFHLSLQQLNGEILTRRHLLTDPFEYRGIREYQPFDDMKSINWKATAKTGEFKVNQKNYTALQSIRIFFNIQDNNILKRVECVEAAIQIVAGLSTYFLKEGMRVGCYGNGADILSGKPVCLSAKSGNEQLENINRSLARVNTEVPVLSFTTYFKELLFEHSEGTYTCFASPHHYDDFLKVVEEYHDTGRDYLWFYPISEDEIPEGIPERILKHIRFIHISI